MNRSLATFFVSLALGAAALAQETRTVYTKIEYAIPMRDGVKLMTEVLVPTNRPGKHPILMERTPYSAFAYTPERTKMLLGDFNSTVNDPFINAGYIIVTQDVRGQFMSEGKFVDVRPQAATGGTDESTDTWDTVDYLVKHVPDNNGRVGLRGISYPGFYAGVGAIHTHPALKAVSPQAPCADWFLGDDVHHNGAFFVQDCFDFCTWFNFPHSAPEQDHKGLSVDTGGKAAYRFFLDAVSAGGLETQYLKGQLPYWNDLLGHPNYDSYWQERALPPRMHDVSCAVLAVGGWFDAEDMWGALNLPKWVSRLNPRTPVYRVMGPWSHGMWGGGPGRTFGDLDYGMDTGTWYRSKVLFPFFEHYLQSPDALAPAAASMFETGKNVWRTFAQWPPKDVKPYTLYLGDGNTLVTDRPTSDSSDTYRYDPATPTPYVQDWETSTHRPSTYMIADQRFLEGRPDVLTYRGPELEKDVEVAGPITADFWVATTGTDMDLVVKVIDQWPADAKEKTPSGKSMAGDEQLLRWDVMRGRFRNSFETPEPFVPGKPAHIRFALNDVFHDFKPGHRIVVQVQSACFPLFDRNPNQFVDISHGKKEDYRAATISVLRDREHTSAVVFGTVK